MTTDDRNVDDANGPDPLDELLSEARWPEPESDRVGRLWATWQRRPIRQSRRLPLAISAAAALMLLGVGIWSSSRRSIESDRVAPPPVIAQKPDPGEAERPVEPELERPMEWIESRPPTAYERILIADFDRGRTKKAVSKKEEKAASVAMGAEFVSEPSKPQPTRENSVVEAIRKLVDDSRGDPGAVVRELLRQTDRMKLEAELMTHIGRTRGGEQLAAVRLLAECATVRSLPMLSRLAERPDMRAVALPAIARLAPPEVVAQMVLAAPDHGTQQVLLAGLLDQGSVQSLSLYLRFVNDSRVSEVAVAAAQQAKHPPIELLFRSLESPVSETQVAAARVLGRIDGPAVTGRLTQMVVRGVHRREAMMALAASPAANAREFVAYAAREPQLAGFVSAARAQLQATNL